MMLLPPSFSQGHAVVTPRGSILGHTYRATAEEAIAAVVGSSGPVESIWASFVAEGYTTQFVYARIFVPLYFPTTSDAKEEQS
ncbi:hypothetical protein [Shinella sp.]|uniref:hypothetical protein n=1 Tax=Shinella sp. TaxID=1870904 RepID=UPI0039E5635E